MTTGTPRRLILTRHAKSSWDDPHLDDHDRPLNRRGLRGALELGDWLASRGYLPEEVLLSSSVRTRETWAAVSRTPLEVMPKIRVLPELYQAGPEKMLSIIATAHADTVMVLGHNPGIGELAAALCNRPPQSAAFSKFPTAATLVLDFVIDGWDELQPGLGSVLDFFTPSKGD